MKQKSMFPELLKIGVLTAPPQTADRAKFSLTSEDNSSVDTLEAHLITALSETLHFKYNLMTPTDGYYHGTNIGGNWTGLIGMLQRKEVDAAIAFLGYDEERAKVADFLYPYRYIPVTFITDAPTYLADWYAMIHPFSNFVWAAVAISMIIMQSILFFAVRKNNSFQNVLFNILSSLLEQGANIKSTKMSTTLLLITWIVGGLFISYAYKAVLLSFLTFPTLTVIRDIPQLAKASEKSSFKCSTISGSNIYEDALRSGGETRRKIADCLSRSNMYTHDIRGFLDNPTYKKAFIGPKTYLIFEGIGHYTSDDVFFINYCSIVVQKSFCCKDMMDKAVHELTAYGIISKIERYFQFNFSRRKNIPPPYTVDNPLRRISLENISGCFVILATGLLLAFAVLIMEIIIHKRKR